MTEEEQASTLLAEQGIELLREMTGGKPLALRMGVSVQAQELLYAAAHRSYGLGQHAQAAQLFAYLMLVDHMDRRYFSGHAACLRAQKKYAEALQSYSVASMLDMTDPQPPMRMAECHMALGDRAKAREALDYALAQARAHQIHNGHVPRLEAMLAFLASDAQPGPPTLGKASSVPSASSAGVA